MITLAASGSTVGCQCLLGQAGSGRLQKSLPNFPARSMNSSQTPRVTRLQLPSFFAHVASTIRTMPFVNRPPSDP